MASAGRGVWQFILLAYFISHIPITLCIDAQAVLGTDVYPLPIQRLFSWYLSQYADPLMGAPPAWFRAIAWVELLAQLPFFFVATYALLRRRNWIRVPLIVYGAHVATTLVPIYGALLSAPGLPTDKLVALCGFYFPYLAIPLGIVWWAARNETLFPNAAPAAKAKTTKRA